MKPLFFLFLLVCCSIQAQSPAKNYQKYVDYRNRLRSDFLLDVEDADCQAACLPMECRRVSADGKVTAYWADGTWWLGHYVAVLATEYRRLQLEKQFVAAAHTLTDLKRALKVYDRLDREAERCWGADTSTNGFYLRDDVPANFCDVFSVDEISSDYAHKCGDRLSVANGPSQDQAWASDLGLALVCALVDDDSVKNHASRIAIRLLSAMQYTDAKGKESWQVVNPVTGAVMQPSTDITWLKYAHARVAEIFSGKACTFGNAKSPTAYQVWQLIQQNFTLDKQGHYNWYGVLSLTTVINESPNLLSTTYRWLVDKCSELSEMRPDLQQPLMFPHLPLINYLLYPQPNTCLLSDTLYEHLLDAAPAGGGHNFTYWTDSGRTAAPWHTLSLFCPWHDAENSSFNMLDYMLLYNLYSLVYTSQKTFVASSDSHFSVQVWPNPVQEKLFLRFPVEAEIRNLCLYSVQGCLLRKLTVFSTEIEVDVLDLPTGFYLLKCEGKKQEVVKFVKR